MIGKKIFLGLIGVFMFMFLIGGVLGQADDGFDRGEPMADYQENKMYNDIVVKDSVGKADLAEEEDLGYIVEFEEEPVIVEKNELEEIAESNVEKLESMAVYNPIKYIMGPFLTKPEDVPHKVEKHKEKVRKNKDRIKERIRKKLDKSGRITGRVVDESVFEDEVVLEEYENVFNGVALSIADEEAEEIEKIDGVKRVVPNLEVQASLSDSVPLIRADQVWGLDSNMGDCSVSGNECLTGKGMKIAILDTGIDYSHTDLGCTGNGCNTQVIKNGDSHSVIHENRIVWERWRSGEFANVFMYDISTGEQIQITNEDIHQFEADVYGDRIVWKEYDPSRNIEDGEIIITYKDIVYYDISTGVSTKITDGNSRAILPAIYGDRIVYSDDRSGDYDVYMYDISTGEETQITDKIGHQVYPDIYEDKIVWMDDSKRDDNPPGPYWRPNFDIYMYDISTGEEIQVTTDPNVQTQPRIYGDKIVWEDDRNFLTFSGQCEEAGINGFCVISNDDVYMYDISTGEESQISSSTLDERLYGINEDRVIWVSGNVDGGLYLYDLTSGSGEVVFGQENKKVLRASIYGDRIAWDDYRNSVESDIDIYTQDLLTGEETQITDVGFDGQLRNLFPNDKVIGGADLVYGDAYPLDDNGHGTHVAAIAAGNGVFKGIAPEAEILAYKVLQKGGSGTFSWILAGIEQANLDGADIISMSLGVDCGGDYKDTCGPDDVVSQTVDNLVRAGTIVVVAAGNDGPEEKSVGSPGTAREVITVGASFKKDYQAFWMDYGVGWHTPCGKTGDDGRVLCDYWGAGDPKVDEIAPFSSRGPVELVDEVINKPDIVAPGAIICAARYANIFPEGHHPYYGSCLDEDHVQIAGTSMATPVVAGAAALMKQAHPDWTPEEIKNALVSTAIDLGEEEKVQGAGRMDVFKAVNYYESRIVNDREEDVVGSLTMNLEREVSGEWQVEGQVVSKQVTLPAGGEFDLRNEWNAFDVVPEWNGRYRVYAEFDYGTGRVEESVEFDSVQG